MRYLRKLRGLVLAVACVVVALLWASASSAHAAPAGNQPTSLSLSITADSHTLTITGKLQSSGKPVAGAQILVSIDAQLVKQATTGGDGSYSTSTSLPSPGDHLAMATFAGDTTYRGSGANQRFTLKSDPSTAPPAPPASSTIAAQLTPNPVHAGDVLSVTGTLTLNGTPIDAARVDISCDFGNVTAMGATDAAGAFSATLGLPSTGQPAALTVTIIYAGDGRFPAAKAAFKANVTAAVTPSVVPTPTIAPTTPLPSIAQVTATRDAGSASMAGVTHRDTPTPGSTAGFFLGAVALYAFAALCVVWVLAWRRHELLPGERRGFGSDFGRRRSA